MITNYRYFTEHCDIPFQEKPLENDLPGWTDAREALMWEMLGEMAKFRKLHYAVEHKDSNWLDSAHEYGKPCAIYQLKGKSWETQYWERIPNPSILPSHGYIAFGKQKDGYSFYTQEVFTITLHSIFLPETVSSKIVLEWQ